MWPEEFHILGAATFAIIYSDIVLVAFSMMLAGGTGVIASNVSAVGPAIVVVGKFARETGCSGMTLEGVTGATTMVPVPIVMRLPGLEVDGLLEEVYQIFVINRSACKSLGNDGDGLGGWRGFSRRLGRPKLQVGCSKICKLLLHCSEMGLVF